MKKKDPIERINVNEISSPVFLKSLNLTQLNWLCEDIRGEILRCVSTYGGHLSPNLGIVELTVALHRQFDFGGQDKLIFDVGHQSYTHKILTGRSLEHLGEVGHTAGFQKISESKYDPYEAGHSSTSISAAHAFAIARDHEKAEGSVVALIGDSSIANGLALEAMNNVGTSSHKIILVLNDNGMSISTPVGAFGRAFSRISTARGYLSFKKGYRRLLWKTAFGRGLYRASAFIKNKVKPKLVPSTLFDNLGFQYIGPVDGHSIPELEAAINRAKNSNKSAVIHVKTIKGKGYVYAENDKTGYWHYASPFDIETGKPKVLHPGFISWSHMMANLTGTIMEKDPKTLLLTPATLKGSGLDGIFARFPDRCRDFGIAEEHAATFAGALALQGAKPIYCIYSTFLQRAYDEISHDCARLGISVTLLIDRAGLCGKNGDTHQGIYDVSFLKSIPNVIVSMPSDRSEASALYHQSLDGNGVFAIRYPREFVPEAEDVRPIDMPLLSWQVRKTAEKKNLAVLAIGPMGRELLNRLNKEAVDVTLINPIYLNPIKKENLALLKGYKHVFVYDPYSVVGGFAESLGSALMEAGFKGKYHVKAIPNAFVPQGSVKEQLSWFNLGVDEIEKEILAILS